MRTGVNIPDSILSRFRKKKVRMRPGKNTLPLSSPAFAKKVRMRPRENYSSCILSRRRNDNNKKEEKRVPCFFF
jgi:hypothetical protein